MAFQSILLEVIGAVAPNSQLRIVVFYNTSNGDNTLSGIGLGFHYDSSLLTFVGSETVFGQNILGEGVYNIEDSNNEDEDISTDRYLSLNYLDTSGNSQWPGGQLPLKLAEFIFETSESFAETEIKIRREPSISPPDYTFSAEPLLLTVEKNEAPTAVTLNNPVPTLAENTDTTNRVKVADIVITDDALGTNTIGLSGSDSASFEVIDSELFLKAGTSLDFETKSSYAVTVNVADTTVTGSNPVTADFTLSVSGVDNVAPVITPGQSFNYAENQTSGLVIGTVAATDALGITSFAITAGNDDGYFAINDAGEITLTNAAGAANDFEVAPNTFTLSVTASDTAGNTSTPTPVTLSLTNVNEATPPSDVVDQLIAPMYRLRNDNVPGTYLFVGEQEAQSIVQNPLYSNFINEGFAFAVATSQSDPLLRPFYRFANTTPGREGTYLFTGEQETQSIRQNYPNFRLDGLAFYALDAGFGNGSTDFGRFQNLDMPGTYLFTGPTESAAILNNYPNFDLEGLAFAAGG